MTNTMSPLEDSDLKRAAQRAVHDAGEGLVALSHEVWDHPELAFEETHSSRVCADVLSDAGFDVDYGVADLDTAFVATTGSGPLTIGICAEYDALPGIGHACGHNMIAAAGVGAGLGLRELADDLGATIKVFGTPAEEGGGGKIIMVERGIFDGVHASMMVHPAPVEIDAPAMLAGHRCDYHFDGKPAHASFAPHEGINAADAVTIAQVAIGLMRQQLAPGEQVHGFVTDGGSATNIIPDSASAQYQVRANTLDGLMPLAERVRHCFEAGAHATGAELTMHSHTLPYSEFEHDQELAALYKANAEALGREFIPRPSQGAASTDMANVSLLMPTIHPMLGLNCGSAVNHQPEFTNFCRTPEADETTLQGAIAMAMTTIDLATDETLRSRLLAGDTSYGHRASYPWTFSD